MFNYIIKFDGHAEFVCANYDNVLALFDYWQEEKRASGFELEFDKIEICKEAQTFDEAVDLLKSHPHYDGHIVSSIDDVPIGLAVTIGGFYDAYFMFGGTDENGSDEWVEKLDA